MFTGIVMEQGLVIDTRLLDGGRDLTIEAPLSTKRLAVGASIAVNGVCLTAVDVTPPRFRVQAVGVTLQRTTLGTLTPGASVNLEPSLRAGDELGGHLVTGHVDGVGTVVALKRTGGSATLLLDAPLDLARYLALRGSVAVNGTSLTIAAVEDRPEACRITIALIPHTLEVTTFGTLTAGDTVNLEIDPLARYLERWNEMKEMIR
jgi:riboflavin synthase